MSVWKLIFPFRLLILAEKKNVIHADLRVHLSPKLSHERKTNKRYGVFLSEPPAPTLLGAKVTYESGTCLVNDPHSCGDLVVCPSPHLHCLCGFC